MNNTDKSQKHYAKQKKSDTKDDILFHLYEMSINGKFVKQKADQWMSTGYAWGKKRWLLSAKGHEVALWSDRCFLL